MWAPGGNVARVTPLRLRSRLLAAGWSDDEVRRLLRAGELSPVRRGVYVAGALPDDPIPRHRLQVRAALGELADGAVVSHVSAAVVHGLPVWGVRLDRVDVTRNRASDGRRSRVVHVRTAPLTVEEVADVDGIPVTSAARTLADIARTLPFEQAVVILDAALASKRVDPQQLAEAALRATGWLGSPRARRAIAFTGAGAQSVGESRSRVVIARAGLPPPLLQWEVIDRFGRRIGFVDFGWERHHTVGEFDGAVKYGRLLRPGQQPGDVVFEEKRREDRLRDEDLAVVRWTWDELDRFEAVADRIRRRFRPW